MFLVVACLPMVINEGRLTETYIFHTHAHARDTPPPPAFASNVAIFLSGWVTCTAYSLPFGVSLWNTVCYRCISRRCYSYCIHSDRKVNINFFYLTLRYSVRIINVSRPVSSSSNQIETSCLAQAEMFLT